MKPVTHGNPHRELRVGIDAHAIGERKTGNERFVSNLIPALRDICDHHLVLYFTRREAADRFRFFPGTTVRLLKPRNRLIRVPLSLPFLARRDRLDVLLVQYTAPRRLPCPVVTVVHDVAFALYPRFLSRFERLWMPKVIPRTMQRAAGIITVSRFSRGEITRVFGIEPKRITVAYDAVAPVFADRSPRSCPVEPPFFLCAGNLQARKNLVTLIRAYGRLIERSPEVMERLVIVGQAGTGAEAVHREIEALPSGRVIYLGYVSDEVLVGLLQRATAFAYPSLYEGFGLPVVEAMAAGAPTVVSDIAVMREVAAEAAVRVAPTDVDAWADALGELATDNELGASLSEKGKVRAGKFTADVCARAVLTALEAAALSRRSTRTSGEGGL